VRLIAEPVPEREGVRPARTGELNERRPVIFSLDMETVVSPQGLSAIAMVQRALGVNGIEVKALHSHMLDEEPRLYFMHFWANGDAEKIARGLRATLDQINTRMS